MYVYIYIYGCPDGWRFSLIPSFIFLLYRSYFFLFLSFKTKIYTFCWLNSWPSVTSHIPIVSLVYESGRNGANLHIYTHTHHIFFAFFHFDSTATGITNCKKKRKEIPGIMYKTKVVSHLKVFVFHLSINKCCYRWG